MKNYVFDGYREDDPDYEGDIDGGEYIKLIDTLFSYSKYFSLDFYMYYANNTSGEYEDFLNSISFTPSEVTKKDMKEWYNNRIPMFGETPEYLTHSDAYPRWKRMFCLCTDETKKLLLEFESLFGYFWKGLSENKSVSENLIFYRADNSLMFFSYTHEGWCALYPRENEDVSEIVSEENWSDDSWRIRGYTF